MSAVVGLPFHNPRRLSLCGHRHELVNATIRTIIEGQGRDSATGDLIVMGTFLAEQIRAAR